MAGIEHKYFGKGKPSGDLFYYIIPPEELPESFSEQFRDKLEILSGPDQEYPYREHPIYYELFNSVNFEELAHLLLKKIDDSISFQDIRYFVRGTRLLPGGNPRDPEQDYWIIEKDKVQKIIDGYHTINFEKFDDLSEIKAYEETYYKQSFSNQDIKEHAIAWIKRVFDIFIPPLEQGRVVVCRWDQS